MSISENLLDLLKFGLTYFPEEYIFSVKTLNALVTMSSVEVFVYIAIIRTCLQVYPAEKVDLRRTKIASVTKNN